MDNGPSLFERVWLWMYTAGLPAEDADVRRAEVRSDLWEYANSTVPSAGATAERLRRFVYGMADDIAWRVDFGRRGFSRGRSHEAALLAAIAAVFFVSLPASVWWVISLAMDPAQSAFQIGYLSTAAISLAGIVAGGAAAAAYYPRLGRVLMVLGSGGLIATLWWAPVVAAILAVAAIATILALPSRDEPLA